MTNVEKKKNVDVGKLDLAAESISETIKNLSEIPDLIQTVKLDFIKMNEEKESLKSEAETLEKQTKVLEEEKTKLDEEKSQLEKDKADRDEKIGEMSQEKEKMLEEYVQIKKDLAEFQKIANEASEAEFNFKEIQNLLKIYSILITEIWGGQPHYKVLNILHGDKELMTKNDIKGATGISGAMVLRTIHELRAAKLVIFDEDEGTVKLVNRMFPKA